VGEGGGGESHLPKVGLQCVSQIWFGCTHRSLAAPSPPPSQQQARVEDALSTMEVKARHDPSKAPWFDFRYREQYHLPTWLAE